jgi:hypothetical protein
VELRRDLLAPASLDTGKGEGKAKGQGKSIRDKGKGEGLRTFSSMAMNSGEIGTETQVEFRLGFLQNKRIGSMRGINSRICVE